MTFITHTHNSIQYLTSPTIDVLGGMQYMFSTRIGGVSEGELLSLNLGMSRDEPMENKLENYRLACNAIGADYTKCVLSKQTHGTNIRLVTSADSGKGITKKSNITDADALVTAEKGIPIAIFYADCVPILLYDPINSVIATIHAGWRGTVSGIASKTVDFMVENFMCKQQNIFAAIGPSIGACCFECSLEVATQFENICLEEVIIEKYGNKCKIDLWKANAKILEKCGVLPQKISIANECTCCNPEKYFSHRKCGADTGRMALIACL